MALDGMGVKAMVFTDGVHLIAETEDELHQFAARIGLKRQWYQARASWPHYDLTTRKALYRALDAGALSVHRMFPLIYETELKRNTRGR